MVQVHGWPLRRSCVCVGLSRATWNAPPLGWTGRDAELIAAIAGFVEAHPSHGFWMCSDQLRKTHVDWNPKRIYRVYKAMKLNLRRSAKRRLPKRGRVALYIPHCRTGSRRGLHERCPGLWSARQGAPAGDLVRRLARGRAGEHDAGLRAARPSGDATMDCRQEKGRLAMRRQIPVIVNVWGMSDDGQSW